MTNYGIQYSAVKPQPIEITNTAVFIASNVKPYSEDIDGRHIEGYKYNCISYTKDEYILLLANKNAQLEQDILDTQLALCDLYESIGGEE